MSVRLSNSIRLLPALLAMTAMTAQARQSVLLATGFVMEVESMELVGEHTILRAAGSEMKVRTSQIVEIQELLAKPPKPAEVPVAVAAVPVTPVKLAKSARQLITEAAERHGLPPEFVHSVARAESAYRETAISNKGAIGLMQLMPATAKQLEVDPHDPEQNADGGAKLLRQLLLKYQSYPDQVRRALSAYNAGEGAVARYNGVPPYRETQGYVEKILREYSKQRKP